MPKRDIVVIGGSAGGVEALIKVTQSLPKNLQAAVFAVIHISPHGKSLLPNILSRRCVLPAIHPHDGQPIEPGKIYLAPPDLHLLVHWGHIRLAHGPKENRHRPAVDPLFRSAAQAYGSRVIAVVLSGSLDDGTAGLVAVKERKGIAIVQNPEEALYDGMPRSAIENVQVDRILDLSEIVPVLIEFTQETVEEETEESSNSTLEIESDIAELDMRAVQNENRPGKESPYSCPECGGVLWELNNEKFLRFRCRTGHAFSAESLLAEQSESLEQALWAALRALKEKGQLARRLAEQAKERNRPISASRFEDQLQEAEQHAEIIRQVLLNGLNGKAEEVESSSSEEE